MRRHNPKANGQPTRAEKKALNRARAAAARAKAAGRGSKGGRGRGKGRGKAARRSEGRRKMTRAERKALNKAGRKARRSGKVSRTAYQRYGAAPIGPRNAKGYFNMKTNPGFTLQGLLDALLGAFRRDQKKVAAAAPKGVGKAVVRRMAETNTARGGLWVRRPARGASGVVVAVSNPLKPGRRPKRGGKWRVRAPHGYDGGDIRRLRKSHKAITRGYSYDVEGDGDPTVIMTDQGYAELWPDGDLVQYGRKVGNVRSMRPETAEGRVRSSRKARGAFQRALESEGRRRKNPSAAVHRASAKKMRGKARRAKQALNKAYYRGAAAAHAGAKKANPRRGRR